MSTIMNHELAKQAYEQGVNAYVVKPINESEFTGLAETIDRNFDTAKVSSQRYRTNPRVVKGWNAARWIYDLKALPNFWGKTATHLKKG
jgi:YesN/AraC family two-component response regulator